jgi:predicted Zn-dependent peptidase
MKRLRTLTAALAACLVVCAAALPVAAQDMESFEKNVTEKKLDNGLRVLVYERPTAPVVSFFTLVDVGSAQEVPGITGIAHMFEHMAFKGTSKIGTNDFKAEKKALDAVDAAYHAYDAERRKPTGADPDKVAQLEQAWKDAQEAAVEYVEQNEFMSIVDRAGGVGLNAFTSADHTGYMFSLPANKVELWAYLESERFIDPVLREFYKERDVVQEEERRLESQPIARLVTQAVATAFTAHTYRYMGTHMSDLKAFSREDAEAFYEKHYVPGNMVVAVVGDVKAEEVIPMVETYFGRMLEGPIPEPLRTVEPEQFVERKVIMPDKSQPLYLEGYHKPAVTHPDDAVYDVLSDILSAGRTSRLYRRLVRDEKIAAAAQAFSGFPGIKYPNLMAFFAMPSPESTNEEVQAAIREEIERIKTEPVTDDELARAKTRAKANLIRGLQSNAGIAQQLASYEMLFGDWRELFYSVERIDKVTAEDILRVANETFKPTNRTVAVIATEDAEGESQ